MKIPQKPAIDYSLPGTERELAYAQALRTVEDLHRLLKDKEEAYRALERAHDETLFRLALAAEYKDGDTGVHLVRMGEISAMLARLLGLDAAFCKNLRHAAPMHDVGKIGVPDEVLKKPGRLTPQEWQLMQAHPAIGANILGGSHVPVLKLAAEVALTHHERFDGEGYPQRLKGEAIPIAGRIVALADYFDALTMDRCYRPKFPDAEVKQMITRESGKHFDARLTDTFLTHWDEFAACRDKINERWARENPASTSAAKRLFAMA
ncbi:MAG: hypothetical protein RIR70_1835 [Pseudomonadota bacterium]|jgi:putative two-component system response regulator